MRRLPVITGVLLSAVALAGCAAGSGASRTDAVVPPPPSGSPSSSPSSSPSASSPSGDADASAAWLDGGRLIGLVTYGSSTCVPVAGDVALGPTGVLTVTLDDPDGACTKDYAPRVTVVTTPADVDTSVDLEIVLAGDYAGDVDLDAVAGLTPGGQTDYLPSAGWTGEDDQLVVLTWGSSGCPPVVASVEPTGPAALTVTFETPPADRICTADIAPRALVVSAPGLEDDVAAQLTLAGGADFDPPVTIPVLGKP